MTKSPLLNACFATGYISLIVTFFSYIRTISDQKLGMIAPVIFLSLLVLSVALMGYLFFFQPLQLMIERKSEEAVTFFLTTLVAFASITGIVLAAWCTLRT